MIVNSSSIGVTSAETDIQHSPISPQNQSSSPRFTSFLRLAIKSKATEIDAPGANLDQTPQTMEGIEAREEYNPAGPSEPLTGGGNQRVTISRQKILALTNVLSRIPHSLLV